MIPDLVERIRRRGPLGADEVIEQALYGAAGFYARGGGAGRRRDFLTSPEVGPLFGAVVARFLDRRWQALGQPDPFVVVEGGAGPGTLVRSVIAAAPACAPALRWVAVERSPALRDEIGSRLDVEPAAQALGGGGTGPVVSVVDDLPAGPLVGAVFANELLDNLPPVLVEQTEDGLAEVRVGVDGDRLVEVLVPTALDAPVPVPVGGRVPLQRAAGRWVQRARTLLEAGTVTCVDYCAPTERLAVAPMGDWLRTYAAHGRGGHWLEALGEQDVTCQVCPDQLRPDRDTGQAEWLRAHGLDDLVAEARATWRERAHIGDLAALRARSAVAEAEALTDPAGLGSFRVLEWDA